MKYHNLSEKWIKASIAGAIWAASEIVLGSFLHNLKVPFSSNILTAIGIIILVSISYIWNEKGLFWRAGLICALMKTMSPSAVIFGPMIAIFAQSVLLETAVRLLGHNMIGYFLGAMLAMSWNFFQKIINYIIFYGYNIVEIYKSVLQYAGKQLHISFDIVWMPILILFILYALFGAVAAVIGIRVGRKLRNRELKAVSLPTIQSATKKDDQTKKNFPYSTAWLLADILLITASLLLMSLTKWYVWVSAVPVVVLVWSLRYKRSLRQLRKPGFWVFFIGLTMLTTFVFSRLQSEEITVLEALLIGIQMNFRAIVMLIGFSAIGTELYNPVIRAFFLRTSFRQLPMALELSFESLPAMIAFLPPVKVLLKNPVSVMQQIIAMAETRLEEIRQKQQFKRKVFIISGKVGEGKTRILEQLLGRLKENNISVGGILAPRIMENEQTIGYDLLDLTENRTCSFLRLHDGKAGETIGRYAISMDGIHFGNEALSVAKNLENKLVVIDEIGKLELSDQGWAAALNELLSTSDNHLILSVRDSFVVEVTEKWQIIPVEIFRLDVMNVDEIAQRIKMEILH